LIINVKYNGMFFIVHELGVSLGVGPGGKGMGGPDKKVYLRRSVINSIV
jgi:hypothetical protein